MILLQGEDCGTALRSYRDTTPLVQGFEGEVLLGQGGK
ncbi:hypothetical protein L483_07185 [Pseudomonas putida H8234]|nr:hypothetical protein L483_07185 [Pseudomonas putida H8234]